MALIEDWIRLYSNESREIRIRAAHGLLEHADSVPLWLLIDILVHLSHEGLGAKTEKALLGRRDNELATHMIALLDAKDAWLREVACNVLARSTNPNVSERVLPLTDDSNVMVRRSAFLALGQLKDKSVLPQLRELVRVRSNDDTNVVAAMQCALNSLQEADENVKP